MGTWKPKLMLGLVAIAAAVTASMPRVSAQNAAVEEFTAFAININSRPTGMSGQAGANRPSTATLTIRIERWSTDEERTGLLTILKGEQNVNRANQALLRAMQRLDRVGTIRESSSLAWDLRYARQNPLPEGGRQIILGTDRPIGFWEARNQPRTIDYPFTILEMRLDKANQGEGKMLADTQISIDPKTNEIVLEHFDLAPVRLNQIRRQN
jgi:hypothetical protein